MSKHRTIWLDVRNHHLDRPIERQIQNLRTVASFFAIRIFTMNDPICMRLIQRDSRRHKPLPVDRRPDGEIEGDEVLLEVGVADAVLRVQLGFGHRGGGVVVGDAVLVIGRGVAGVRAVEDGARRQRVASVCIRGRFLVVGCAFVMYDGKTWI